MRNFFQVRKKAVSQGAALATTPARKRSAPPVEEDCSSNNKKAKVETMEESDCVNTPDSSNIPPLPVVASTPTAAAKPLEKCLSAKQPLSAGHEHTFPIGDNFHYKVISSNGTEEQHHVSWFESFWAGANNQAAESEFKAVVGLDCEWCPPWFREKSAPERINTIQLYSPHADALILSITDLDALPAQLVDLFADPRIAKVGVNIGGDGARIARDFGCHVNGLVNVATGHKGKKSMQDLCKAFCPSSFHIDKDSVENGVRMGNWAAWPLSELQIKYAAMDACLSFAIFLYRNKGDWNGRRSFSVSISSCKMIENADPAKQEQLSTVNEDVANDSAEKNSNFYLMHRNKSIPPPNLGSGKERPQGPTDCLADVCVVVSGVLDSMSRDDMTKYVQKHGGRVVKGITKAVTHLLNDVEGTVGPAKLEKCRSQGVPVVGEDVIFGLVRSRTI